MIRFSSAVLARTHRFLLEIHATDSVETQRRLIPQHLAELIPCDRAAFNEFEIGPGRMIVPSPVPAYWTRLRPVITRHLHEHALITEVPPLAHKAVTFGDRRHDSAWKKSALFHEYYLPARARHQLSVHVFQRGSSRYLLNCNRWACDFSSADRALLELLSPHVECAWRNASRRALLQRSTTNEVNGNESLDHIVVVDLHGRIATELSARARTLLQTYFSADTGVGNPLPEPLHRWLSAQRRHLQTTDALGSLPEVLPVRHGNSTLAIRLGQIASESAVILLSEHPPAGASRMRSPVGFTPRESEIARWLREGKRNAEIGAILGISRRTVGKHVEHVLEKLGVETRTAAGRVIREQPLRASQTR